MESLSQFQAVSIESLSFSILNYIAAGFCCQLCCTFLKIMIQSFYPDSWRTFILKFIRQFSIILAISLAGEALSFFLPLPVPAGIYGILLLLIFLITGILKEVSSFLIELMPIMFIPAAAGLMQSYHLLAPSLFAYIVIIVFSTVAVMMISGHVTQRIIRKKSKEEHNDA